MENVRSARLARGKRVVVVKPVDSRRDPSSAVALTIGLGHGGTATALLTDSERKRLIEALGGKTE